MDPHGFILRGRWDTSSHDSADAAMREMIANLESTDLKALDALSNNESMVESLQRHSPLRTWHATYSALYKRCWPATRS